jgi:hypothetical protein
MSYFKFRVIGPFSGNSLGNRKEVDVAICDNYRRSVCYIATAGHSYVKLVCVLAETVRVGNETDRGTTNI